MYARNLICCGVSCVAAQLLLLSVALAEPGPVRGSGVTGGTSVHSGTATTGPSGPSEPADSNVVTLGCESVLTEPISLGAPIEIVPPLRSYDVRGRRRYAGDVEAQNELKARIPHVLNELGLTCPETNGKCFECPKQSRDRSSQPVELTCRASNQTPEPVDLKFKLTFDKEKNRFRVSGTIRGKCEYSCF